MGEMVSKEDGSEAIVAKVLNDSEELKHLKGGSSLTVTVTVDAEVAAKLKKGLDLHGKYPKKSLQILSTTV